MSYKQRSRSIRAENGKVKKSRRLVVRMAPEQYQQLENIAASLGENVSYVVRLGLRKFIGEFLNEK